MTNNSARNNVIAIGSALENFKSIGSAKTGGERLKKIASLIATAYGMK